MTNLKKIKKTIWLNPSWVYNHIGCENYKKKLNIDLKIDILKMLSKNSVSSTLTATLEI